jgi:cytochrome c oxidase cbb3-type subunit 3
MNKLVLAGPQALVSLILLVCCACTARVDPVVASPGEVLAFDVLYGQNCAGCHGPGGKDGAAIALADPVFLAIADDAAIRRTITNGVPMTPMSAFAQSAGGMLTDQQVDALVRGIRAWANPAAVANIVLPSYAAQAAGDAQRGADAYKTFCSSCHGAEGRGGSAGSIVDGSYLALVSNQDLRSNVILGRPTRGAPDWRNDVAGKPMSEQEISDVVAWLDAQRSATPGQPYPTTMMDPKMGGVQ